MDQTGIFALPPFLPALREEFLRIGDVADGRIEPYVEHLAFRPIYRNGHAPVQVAAHGTRLQTAVQPALALAIDIGLPLFVPFQDPFPKPGLVTVQRQVPVFGLYLLGRGAGQGRFRIDQLFRAQGGTAFLALVAVRVGIAALGAGTGDVTVGQEGAGLLVVILLGLLGNEFIVVVELAEELGSILLVYLGGGAGVDVKVDAEPGERILHDAVVFVHDVLRGDSLGARLDGNGHAVFIGSADEDDILAFQTEVADVNVARNVGAGEVADMDRTVRIGECAGHEGPFVVLAHMVYAFFILFRVLI